MKKIIIAGIAVLLFASAAFAGNSIKITDFSASGLTLYGGVNSGDAAKNNTAGQKTLGKTSTGVGVGALSATTGYAVVTQHKSGNKEYGSSFDSTAIYMIDAVVGKPTLDVPTKTDSTDFLGANWSTM